jgi:hypothetical protein
VGALRSQLLRLAPDRVRGLGGVQLVISDHDRALMNAIEAAMAGVAWQRCRLIMPTSPTGNPCPATHFPSTSE